MRLVGRWRVCWPRQRLACPWRSCLGARYRCYGSLNDCHRACYSRSMYHPGFNCKLWIDFHCGQHCCYCLRHRPYTKPSSWNSTMNSPYYPSSPSSTASYYWYPTHSGLEILVVGAGLYFLYKGKVSVRNRLRSFSRSHLAVHRLHWHCQCFNWCSWARSGPFGLRLSDACALLSDGCQHCYCRYAQLSWYS